LASKDSFYYKDGITGKYIERKKVNFDNKETEYVTKDTSTIYIRFEDAYRKLQYDLYYIKNHDIIFDMKILLKTVTIVIFGKGR